MLCHNSTHCGNFWAVNSVLQLDSATDVRQWQSRGLPLNDSQRIVNICRNIFLKYKAYAKIYIVCLKLSHTNCVTKNETYTYTHIDAHTNTHTSAPPPPVSFKVMWEAMQSQRLAQPMTSERSLGPHYTHTHTLSQCHSAGDLLIMTLHKLNPNPLQTLWVGSLSMRECPCCLQWSVRRLALSITTTNTPWTGKEENRVL